MEWFSVDFFLAFLVACALGTFSGLGAGGGTLLIIWLTDAGNFPFPDARIINLLFFIPVAFTATIIHIIRKRISLKPLLPAILCGCLSCLFFSYLSRQWNMHFLRKSFGILLVFIAFKELRTAKAKKAA